VHTKYAKYACQNKKWRTNLKTILCHLVFYHPNSCIVGQDMQGKLLLVECSDKIADGPAIFGKLSLSCPVSAVKAMQVELS